MYDNLKILGQRLRLVKKEVAKFHMKVEDALIVTIDGAANQIFCQEKISRKRVKYMFKEILIIIIIIISIVGLNF